jgi:hypothetical protein
VVWVMALACLIGPHLLLVAAQVPTIEELGSRWQPVRMCRPLAAAPLVRKILLLIYIHVLRFSLSNEQPTLNQIVLTHG